MNVSKLRTLFLNFMQEADATGFWDSDKTLNFLNAGKDRFEAEAKCYLRQESYLMQTDKIDSLSTSSGKVLYSDYPLPDFVDGAIVKVKDSGGISKLSYIGDIDYEGQDLPENQYFSIIGNRRRLRVYNPIDSDDYTLIILYNSIEPDFVNMTDEPAIPLKYHMGIVYAAVLLANLSEGESIRDVAALYDRMVVESLTSNAMHDNFNSVIKTSNEMEDYIGGY